LTCELQEIDHEQTLKPSLHGKAFEEMPESDLQEHCGYLMEWLAMVQMNSPRVSWEDDVDPYLSRYAVPDAEDRTDLISLKWHGMMSSSWVMNLFTLM
jgi:ribonuclease P/MRP protein subunit RPP40